MNGKRYTPEHIIHKLREAEVELGKGATVPVACKKLGGTEQPTAHARQIGQSRRRALEPRERAPCGRIRTLTVMR